VLGKCKSSFSFAAGLNIICFLNVSASEFGSAQTPSEWRGEDVSSGVKAPVSVAKDLILSSSEIGSMWSYMSSSLYAFMKCQLGKEINLPLHISITNCA